MASSNSTVAWVEDGDKLVKLSPADFKSEAELEDRVFAEPSLVEPGLVILARQLTTDAGQLDLLGLDTEGRVVVVELKKAQTDRDTVAQVLDYAACLSETPFDLIASAIDASRVKWNLHGMLADLLKQQGAEDPDDWWRDQELRLVVVGRGEDPSLRRIVRYAVGKYSVPLNGVFLDLFRLDEGRRVLVRTSVIGDTDAQLGGRGKGRHHVDAEAVAAVAREFGTAGWCDAVVAQWTTSTGTAPSTERKRDAVFYRLKARGNRKKGVAQLFPRNFEIETKGSAWIQVDTAALAVDVDQTEAAIRGRFATASPLEDGWVEVKDQATSDAFCQLIADLYLQAPAPVAPASGIASTPPSGETSA